MKSFCHIYAQWDQVGNMIGEDAGHLLDLGLVCDTTFNLKQGHEHAETLRKIIAAGGLCAPNVYPATCDPECRDSNWWKYSEEECVRLLHIAREKYLELGLGPLTALNTYTPGNPFVAACRRSGIGYLLGFCAPIVIEDGGWEIAHYGSPLSPYFIGEEDYRKPENPGNRADAVLISSMELRNPLVCQNHWSEGPWCPLNAQAADRWLEPTADPLPFLAIAEDWLRQAELSGDPSFFHINLQYFFAGRCREHNRRALEWLAEQRDKGRLEIGGLQQWAQRLKSEGGFKRQTTYWRGEMMGFHVGHRPGCFPDVAVDESLDHQGIWQKPDPLPKRYYDYSEKWDYPAFKPKGGAPASVDFSGLEVSIEKREDSWVFRIRNSGKERHVPLMCWDVAEGWEAPFTLTVLSEEWRHRFLPHPAGAGTALLLEGRVQEGETSLELKVMGSMKSQRSFSRSWPDLVEAQTFYHLGRPYTVLASQTPEPFTLRAKLTLSSPEPVLHEHLCGIDYLKEELCGTEADLRFDGRRLTCWHRFWGVTVDQIELEGCEETRTILQKKTAERIYGLLPSLVPDGPGYQLFGNIRDASRWDRSLARAAGLAEKIKANEYLRERISEATEIVVEVHPGIYLPRGSITKVLGHEFDDISCSTGYEFKELCADYPQGWDWGVSAWVQWRNLKLQVKGLSKDPGMDYHLHLQACDPEGRDVVQRVHFFNPLAAEASPEICAVKEWVLPVGLEARWQPEALCSVRIPDLCREWTSLGIWIVPLEKGRLYDWVREKGAPGVFSHLWVTKTRIQAGSSV